MLSFRNVRFNRSLTSQKAKLAWRAREEAGAIKLKISFLSFYLRGKEKRFSYWESERAKVQDLAER